MGTAWQKIPLSPACHVIRGEVFGTVVYCTLFPSIFYLLVEFPHHFPEELELMSYKVYCNDNLSYPELLPSQALWHYMVGS